MTSKEAYDLEQRSLLKPVLVCLLLLALSLGLVSITKIIELEETTKAFKNSEVLVCYETLIVSDSNWKLVDRHLINNNSAGYLLIDNCKIKRIENENT